mmetsp:Transcript_54150/g.162141  ORF Transcript_54150/g.162141 Transcript_54150/m.162141 type:complete len:256 (-) Transcript_54150:2494-3261(-)
MASITSRGRRRTWRTRAAVPTSWRRRRSPWSRRGRSRAAVPTSWRWGRGPGGSRRRFSAHSSRGRRRSAAHAARRGRRSTSPPGRARRWRGAVPSRSRRWAWSWCRRRTVSSWSRRRTRSWTRRRRGPSTRRAGGSGTPRTSTSRGTRKPSRPPGTLWTPPGHTARSRPRRILNHLHKLLITVRSPVEAGPILHEVPEEPRLEHLIPLPHHRHTGGDRKGLGLVLPQGLNHRVQAGGQIVPAGLEANLTGIGTFE